MDDKLFYGITMLVCIIFILFGSFIVHFYGMKETQFINDCGCPCSEPQDVVGKDQFILYDVTGYHRMLDTGSMEPVIKYNDRVLIKEISISEQLTEGKIYSFRRGTQLVAHYLTKDCTQGCSGLIFTSEKSKLGEIVNRSSVVSKIRGIEYNYYD